MTFIDWSDSEGMFGLLVEFVADEGKGCIADEDRRNFLAGLLSELTAIERRIGTMETGQMIQALEHVRDGFAHEFADDPVLVHVAACIEELERLREDA